MKKIVLICALPFVLFGCSDDKDGAPKPNKADAVQLDVSALTVSDEYGRAIAGAKILIGNAQNSPFAGNFLTTDAHGQAALPPAWHDAQPVTVQASGYVRLTQFGRSPKGAIFRLRATDKAPTLQVSGTTTGHPVQNGDGFVDFGLVLPSLKRNDLLALNLSKIISAQTDTVSVFGQSFDLPSNVTLPQQRESYIFVPITLEKPNFRLSFSEAGTHRVYGAMARFPFKSVISDIRGGKKFYDLVNSFTIMGGTFRDVNVQDGVTQNLPVNEMSYSSSMHFKAPAIPGDEVMMALSAIDTGDGSLVPTDVKKFESNETKALALPAAKKAYALAMLKNANEFDNNNGGVDRVSVVIAPFTEGFSPRFLPLVRDPRVMANGDLQLAKPALPSGVNDLATYATLSEVRSVPLGNNGNLPFLVHLWEVYAPNWVDGMTLPQWPEATPLPAKKRWEVSYIGSQSTKEDVELGQAVIDAATHVTHSSVDY